MGYTETLVGDLVRERLIDSRKERWRTRLREQHGLTAEELDTLGPYIEYVSHYGSRKELVALVLLFSPFVLGFLGIMLFMGGSSLAMGAAVLTGGSSRAVAVTGLLLALIGVLPIAFLVLIGAFLWRRWNRYQLATDVREQLTAAPRRLCADDDPLPRTREEIANMNKTTFSHS